MLVIGATGMLGQPVARTGLCVYDEGNTVNTGSNVDYQCARNTAYSSWPAPSPNWQQRVYMGFHVTTGMTCVRRNSEARRLMSL